MPPNATLTVHWSHRPPPTSYRAVWLRYRCWCPDCRTVADEATFYIMYIIYHMEIIYNIYRWIGSLGMEREGKGQTPLQQATFMVP